MENARANKALITLVIGPPEYREGFERQVLPSWQRYAETHGYDVVVIDDWIDGSPRGRNRSPNWQKCLILEDARVRAYDDVVWLDADVLINYREAPCIVAANRPGKVGLVSVRSYPERLFTRRLASPHASVGQMIEETYRKAGLEPVGEWANTGVMVLRPADHAALLRHVYDAYEEGPHSAKEELPLSHHLFGGDHVHRLDPRFNQPWIYRVLDDYAFLLREDYRREPEIIGLCVNTAWSETWFMHFTSDAPSTRHHLQMVVPWADRRQAYDLIRDNFGRAG